MYRVEDVAKWFLSKSGMTPKKLQKMLYYAYAWYLTLENDDVDHLENRLFEPRFEAWVHGPVIPHIYQKYRELGFSEINKYEGEIPTFDEDTTNVLEQVMNVYGGYNGNQLESITHQELPWRKAREGYLPLDRCNEFIEEKDMFEYYIQQLE